MRRFFIMLGLCLWAVWVFANGDGPPKEPSSAAGQLIMRPTTVPIGATTQEGGAEGMDSAPWATGVMEMQYTIGPPGQDAVPTRFILRCVVVGKSPIPDKAVDVPPGQAPPNYRATIDLAAFLPQPTANTAYECTQAPWNSQIGEGPASPPYPFVATLAGFANTAVLRIKK